MCCAALALLFAQPGLAQEQKPAAAQQSVALDQAFDAFVRAVAESKAIVEKHPFYARPENRAAGMAFITHMMIDVLQKDINQDPDYPFFRVMDFNTRVGGDNPDQRYLMSPLRGGQAYRVWGRLGKERRLEFQVIGGTPWVRGKGRTIGGLTMEQVKFEKDGRFEVLLSPTRTGANWIECPPDASEVIIRQVFSDWKNETPGEIHIDRIGHEGALKPPMTEAAMAERLQRAAADLVQTVQMWPDFVLHHYVQAAPANTLSTPADPGAQGGVKGRWMSSGHFDLAEDEALIITTWPMGGNYQGVQLTDPWFSSLEYANRQASLSGDQAYRSKDGAYRFVVSARNPGVQNWLDTGGLRQGTILLRFDGMPGDSFAKDKAPTAQVVKLRDLAAHLPADTPAFSEAALSKVLAERRRHLQVRLGN